VLDIGAIMLFEPYKGVGLACRLLSSVEQRAYLEAPILEYFKQYEYSQVKRTGVCAPRSLASATAFACRSLICIYRAFPPAYPVSRAETPRVMAVFESG